MGLKIVKLDIVTRINSIPLKDDALDLIESSLQLLPEADQILIIDYLDRWINEKETFTFKTSGSTGVPKTIQFSKSEIFDSANRTISFFDLNNKSNLFSCLPMKGVGGSMMLFRALVSECSIEFHKPALNPLNGDLNLHYDLISLTPQQVYHILNDTSSTEKLKSHFKNVLIGGGILPKSTKDKLKSHSINAYESYGMTETLSHIAIRSIFEEDQVFKCLPGITISSSINDCLIIHHPCLGTIETNDVIDKVSDNAFRYKGRYDAMINSGGIKLNPETIEWKISELLQFPFFIASIPDDELGEKLVLVIESTESTFELETLKDYLERYEMPKKVLFFPNFLFTNTGKVDRLKTIEKLLNE